MNYNRIKENAELTYAAIRSQATSPELQQIVAAWTESTWVSYLNFVVLHVPINPEGKTVLDFGCGHGLLAPLLLSLGAARYIGVDIGEFSQLSELFSAEEGRVQFVNPDEGYLPLDAASVDLVIANEVISHVPPKDLPTIYEEWGRIVRPAGGLLVSDGNSLEDAAYFKRTLLPLYEAVERGAPGASFGEPPFIGQIACSYQDQRRNLLRSWFPSLTEEQATFLAANTAPLATDRLRRAGEQFLLDGTLIKRPYRPGHPPVNPAHGGVEERGFRPASVAADLETQDFSCVVRGTGMRPAAPWTEVDTQFSFPTQNFQIWGTRKTH